MPAPKFKPTLTLRGKRDIQDKLNAEFGDDGGKLIDLLKDIAFGRMTVTVRAPDKSGLILEWQTEPTFAERAQCAQLMLAYQHGRPRQQLEVQHTSTVAKWDPDKLSLKELELLEELAIKAELPEGEPEE